MSERAKHARHRSQIGMNLFAFEPPSVPFIDTIPLKTKLCAKATEYPELPLIALAITSQTPENRPQSKALNQPIRQTEVAVETDIKTVFWNWVLNRKLFKELPETGSFLIFDVEKNEFYERTKNQPPLTASLSQEEITKRSYQGVLIILPNEQRLIRADITEDHNASAAFITALLNNEELSPGMKTQDMDKLKQNLALIKKRMPVHEGVIFLCEPVSKPLNQNDRIIRKAVLRSAGYVCIDAVQPKHPVPVSNFVFWEGRKEKAHKALDLSTRIWFWYMVEDVIELYKELGYCTCSQFR